MTTYEATGEFRIRFRHRFEADSESEAWDFAQNELTMADVAEGADTEWAEIDDIVEIPE